MLGLKTVIALFGLYLFYSAYKGWPSILFHKLSSLGYRKRHKELDGFLNTITGILAIMIAITI